MTNTTTYILAATIKINGVTNTTYYPVIRSVSATDPTFEPYDSSSIILNLGRDVYGGTVDVVNGTLTVDRGMVDLGTMTWNYDSDYARFKSTSLKDIMKREVARATKLICSAYRSIHDGSAFDPDWDGCIYGSNGDIFVHDHTVSTVSDFVTKVTGRTLVYPLATPQTYTLTPQLLALLKGYNRISGDGVITIGYQGKGESDVQTELDEHSEKLRSLDTLTSSIAPVETSTASANYAVGDYLMLDGSLCKVTSAIATGETIAIGSNVTVTTVAAELLAIIAQM